MAILHPAVSSLAPADLKNTQAPWVILDILRPRFDAPSLAPNPSRWLSGTRLGKAGVIVSSEAES